MDCPYYEEHGGEYYQGMWEFEDCCYFSQVLDYECNCGSNSNCWYKRKNANKEILELIEKYFGPGSTWEQDANGKMYEQKTMFLCEPSKDNLVEHIKTIVKTLEEME